MAQWVNVFTVRQVYELIEKSATSFPKPTRVYLKMSLVWRCPGPSNCVREGHTAQECRQWLLFFIPCCKSLMEWRPRGDLQLDCPSFPSLYWVLRDPDLLMLSVLQIFVLLFGSITEGGILPGFSVNGELQLMLTFRRWFLLDIDRPWLDGVTFVRTRLDNSSGWCSAGCFDCLIDALLTICCVSHLLLTIYS